MQANPQKPYALFKGDEKISKDHSTPEPVWVEAFERGLVVKSEYGRELAEGYEVRRVE